LVPLPASAGDALQTISAQRVSMPLEYQLDGVVEARRQATLSAEVSGQVETVNFDVDDFVDKGAVVMTIRDREYRARRQQAVAALDEAAANLRQTRLEFERQQDLRNRKLISQAEFDRASANLEAANARKSSAEASLERAEEELRHTVVRAPYSGIVVERFVEPGESVNPGQPIMSGYSRQELRVVASVPQSLIGGLRERREARVIVLESDISLQVTAITIPPYASSQNHSFPVRLDLPGVHDGLYPGMLVKVAIAIGTAERVLVPASALVSRSEVNAVYVIEDGGGIALRQVRPGNRFGERVEILAGLEADESIAIDPVRAGIEYRRRLEADR
jgi:RND family efflux transporter MFP subunit